MTNREIEAQCKMEDWIRKYRRDPRVVKWIARHPPPVEWEGRAIEYAYLEMPDPDSLIGRFVSWLGA